jgi:glycylpeptide N-tetradecanoyltransferase
MVKKFALPAKPLIRGFREMTKADVPQVGVLLRKYMARFDIVQTFEKDEEIEHWFLSGRGTGDYQPGGGKGRDGQVVWAYVVEVRIRTRPEFTTPI